jgi:hypothetical protein
MRKLVLISAAALGGIALATMPVAAQHREEEALRGAGEMVQQAAPMVGRSADAALELDVGPLLDALHPDAPRGRHLTLREIGRSNDPDFDRKLQRSIYRGSARASAMLNAMAAAAPEMRRSLHDMRAAIGAAMVEARRPLPPEGGAPPAPPSSDDDDEGAPW